MDGSELALPPISFLSSVLRLSLLSSVLSPLIWGGRWDSNPRRPDPQSGALPTELRPPLPINRATSAKLAKPHHILKAANLTTQSICPQMARPAGLEPATYGLEGRCSIRLSYGRIPSPSARGFKTVVYGSVVGAAGFEPTTLCSQSRCATRLRYAPTYLVLPMQQGPRSYSGRKATSNFRATFGSAWLRKLKPLGSLSPAEKIAICACGDGSAHAKIAPDENSRHY